MPSSSRKAHLSQVSTIPPKLNVLRPDAQQKLQDHIEMGYEIINRPVNSDSVMDQFQADSETWWEYSIRLLTSLFETSMIADDYKNQTGSISISIRSLPYQEEIEIFRPRMASRIRGLESILKSLDLYQENVLVISEQYRNASKDPQTNALAKIELIANRFHMVARQLRHRHAGRNPLTISDEYDVQDLFHALLKLFFDDIRSEEYTPSSAGVASRIDFLLKEEQILVELKMTRPGLTKGKEISEQLIVDSIRYCVHPDCKVLVAFVYDPQEYLNNPNGIERDLTKTINGVPVKVFIRSR